jgi:hypothetical protein
MGSSLRLGQLSKYFGGFQTLPERPFALRVKASVVAM